MKIKQSRLKQLIKEELANALEENKPFNPAGLDDSKDVTWDDLLDDIRDLFARVAIDVIDYYEEKPDEFGILTKEDARKEIIEVLQATVDTYVNDDLPGGPGLGELLDEEFDRPEYSDEDREEMAAGIGQNMAMRDRGFDV